MADKTLKTDEPAPPAAPGQGAGRGGTLRLIGDGAPAEQSAAPPRVVTIVMDDPAEPRRRVSATIIDVDDHPPAPSAPAPAVSPQPAAVSDEYPASLTPSAAMVLVQGRVAVGSPDAGNARNVAREKTVAMGAIANRRDITSLGAMASGQRVGHFVLDSPLGEGSYGQVFLAHDERLPLLRVAVKIIPMRKQSLEDTNKELAALASVAHPNIVSLLDHGVGQLASAGGAPLPVAWFAMPFYKGTSLAERVAERPLSPELAFRWFRALASAVAALHTAGLRHQDIKPENVFIANFSGGHHGAGASGEEYELPILLDLGVATGADDSRFLAGTPEYFAPEQAYEYQRRTRQRGGEPMRLSNRMDVYALALTLFHALGARTAFDQAFERSLAGHGDEPTPEVERAERYAQALAADPLLATPFRLRKLVLPSFSLGPRRRLAEKLRRWFAIDAQDRATIDEFYDDLQVLLGMQALRLELRRTAVLSVMLGGVLGVGGVVGNKYLSQLKADATTKDRALEALGAQIDGCLRGSAEARKTYEKLVEEKNLCQSTLGTVKDDMEQGKRSISSEQRKLLDCRFGRDADRGVCEGEKRDLREQVARWTASTHAEAARADGLGGQLRAAQAEKAQCDGQLQSCSVDRARQAQQLAATQEQLSTTIAQLSATRSELAACQGGQASCQQQLASCNAARTQMATSLAHAQVQSQQSAACASSLQQCQAQSAQQAAMLQQCRR
jgi:serine/threonine protein kinase